jgi:hypothetical protein
MKESMPGDLVLYSPWEEFGTGIATRVDRGPNKFPVGKCGPVTITRPGGVTTTIPSYPEAKLNEIIEQGTAAPRPIPPELLDEVEHRRVQCKEDHKIIEQQYAGFASSGTFGSLDGRNNRRPKSNIKTEAQK